MSLATLFSAYCEAAQKSKYAEAALKVSLDTLAESALLEARSVHDQISQLPMLGWPEVDDGGSAMTRQLNMTILDSNEAGARLLNQHNIAAAIAEEARIAARTVAGLAEMLPCPVVMLSEPTKPQELTPWQMDAQRDPDGFTPPHLVTDKTALEQADREVGDALNQAEDSLGASPEALTALDIDPRVERSREGVTSAACCPQETTPLVPLGRVQAQQTLDGLGTPETKVLLEPDDLSHQRKPARRRRKGGAS